MKRDRELYKTLRLFRDLSITTSIVDKWGIEKRNKVKVLENSEYIVKLPGELNFLYKITDKGWQFIRNQELELIKKATLFLTVILTLCGVIASWYYGVEIWEYYHPWHCR